MPEMADALVLFGATGDLSKRKLFPALYFLEKRGRLDLRVVGVARSGWDDAAFRDHARTSIDKVIDKPDPAVVDALCRRLVLVDGDYSSIDTFQRLAGVLAQVNSSNALFYLAIPPSLFPTVVRSLAAVGLNRRGRLVVEKPFGRDFASAVDLNNVLHEFFNEDQIFRIDHYLGKESVEDLLVFRFSNSFLEPIWNRRYVSSVQITMAENLTMEGRGAFYDTVGAIRDVVQNHLLQVLTLLAMEPPVGPETRHLQDEKVKVLMAMRPVDTRTLVRGQYRGYRDEPGVAPDTTVETFAAMRLEIDSWRWAGVPFYVRAGKGLSTSATEAVIELREPPRLLFDEIGGPPPDRNLIRFRLGNNDGVTLTVQAKMPGEKLDSQPVNLSVDFAAALGERHDAYDRLLGDALAGNQRRFGREDIVEETWRIVQPALDEPGPIHFYDKGSWGPAQANGLFDAAMYWHDPAI